MLIHWRNFDCVSMWDEAFEYLPLCHKLKHFSVDSAVQITIKTLEYLCKLENLQSISLDCCHVDMNVFNWFFKNARLRNLENLALRDCSIEDTTLILIAAKCKKLKQFDLFTVHSTDYTDVGVNAIAERCSKLEYLELSYNRGITGEIFSQVPKKHLQNLREISFQNCEQDDNFISNFACLLSSKRNVYLNDENDNLINLEKIPGIL